MKLGLLCANGFLVCLLWNTSNAKAKLADEIAQQVPNRFESDNVLQDSSLGSVLSANFEADKLANRHVLSATALLSPDDIQSLAYRHFDFDHLGAQLTNDDFALVSSTAVVLRNVSPRFFTHSRITTPGFVEAYFPSTINTLELDDDRTVIVAKMQVGSWVMSYKIESRIYSGHYDFIAESGQFLAPDKARAFIDLAPDLGHLQLVNTNFVPMHHAPKGSLGGRNVNFFYAVPGGHTLMYSLRIALFKKDRLLSPFWGRLRDISEQQLRADNLQSIVKVQNYVNEFVQDFGEES